MKFRIRTEDQRAYAMETLAEYPLPARMELHEGDDRSLEQNRMSWVLYGEIAKHMHEAPEDAHRRCKLEQGVPILRRDSEDFRQTYDRLIKPMPYPDKIDAMDLIDVTKLMTVAQMTEYLDAVFRHYASEGVRFSERPEAA